jgi:hypothetical protein
MSRNGIQRLPHASVLAGFSLLVCAGVGCAGDSTAPRSPAAMTGAAGSGAIPAAANPSAPFECEIGSHPCFCADGSQSGSQFCDARHQLSACSCAGFEAGGPTPARGESAGICSELSGMQTCQAASYVSPQVQASILFVVDRSGSMACNAPPVQSVEDCNKDPRRAQPGAPSRWETTVAALDQTFAGLSGRSAAIGLSLFSSDGACGADSVPQVGLSPVDDQQITALSSALDRASPAGGTPIVGSVVLAYKHLHQELHAGGNRFVVLITDGEESCGSGGDEDDKANLAAARKQLLEVEVGKARDANIRTFVIGAPGSEGARGFLSELAFRGGTARTSDCQHGDPEAMNGDCHFDLTTAADFANVLGAALGKISGEAIGCEFRTPNGLSQMVNVQYSASGSAPTCFRHDDAACNGGANGWQFKKAPDGSDDLTSVVLCGAACETVKSNPNTTVDVILGCASVM